MTEGHLHHRSGHHSQVSRRNILGWSAGLGLSAALIPQCALADNPPATNTPNVISPQEALDRLMAGNRRYVSGSRTVIVLSKNERAERLKSQYPIASILACSDSRVIAESAFDQGPGDLFVIRIAGNVADGDGLGSIEYAIKYLGTPLVMVLGHTHCGAVSAAIKVADQKLKLSGNLADLIDEIKPAVEAARTTKPTDLLEAAVIENVRRSVKQLPLRSEPLRAALEAGQIEIVGAIYDLASGEVRLT